MGGGGAVLKGGFDGRWGGGFKTGLRLTGGRGFNGWAGGRGWDFKSGPQQTVRVEGASTSVGELGFDQRGGWAEGKYLRSTPSEFARGGENGRHTARQVANGLRHEGGSGGVRSRETDEWLCEGESEDIEARNLGEKTIDLGG
ncbi:hypothetical protein TIFTF001_024802 [Ficus carica]|uniref:Uncharacterized protein n=1 Tax=Ficus carica TaxID=3494 RepID=A0AA88ALX8_FICCA|nr:hypothetical protein TIFTF001_024802 [Ficus carica]